MRFSIFISACGLILFAAPLLAQQKPAAPASRAAVSVPAPAAPRPAPPATPARTPAEVDGFRSAKFGMTASNVHKAIQADFGVSDNDIKLEINPVQKTTALMVDVHDLLPGTGIARVSYTFGASKSTLFSIVVVWAKAFSPAATREVLVDAAGVLRSHFETETFARGVLTDAALSDGSVLVFRGIDAEGRMVALTSTGLYNINAADGAQKDAAQPDPVLRLTYLQDPQHPDVYTIKQGDF